MIFAVDAALLVGALLSPCRVLRAPPPRARLIERMPPGSLRAALPLAVSFFCFALLFLALAGMLPAYLVERARGRGRDRRPDRRRGDGAGHRRQLRVRRG